MNDKALSKIGYGLYVLTTNYDGKDNGCIINSVMQVTSEPTRLAVAVNKMNYTHDLILDSCVLNLSVLTVDAPFEVYEHFGYQSGKEVNKFAECTEEHRTTNNVLYVPKYANAYFACRVTKTIDLGTHTMFIAEVIDAEILSDRESATYDYYQKNIKPEAKPKKTGKKQWVCKVCGWIYEGDELPDDIVCPICKHGKADFEEIK